MPQLRSLYIPHFYDYFSSIMEPRELANQIIDIVTLRPEIRLCYLGIGPKCFEVLEAHDSGQNSSAIGTGFPDGAAEGGATLQPNGTSADMDGTAADNQGDQEEDTTDDEEEEDEDGADGEEEGETDEEDEDDDDDNTPTSATSDPDETQSDNEAGDHDDDSDDDGFIEPDKGRVKLRLREILFYDDKVAIFRARHGKL